MKPIHDELWKLPQDTLALASDYDISPVVDDEEIAGMDFLSESSSGKVNYDEIKYEIPTDTNQILQSNVEYGLYELSEADRVLKDNVKYISLKYICRNLNRTVDWVIDRDILHNLFYILDSNGDRLYREPEVVERCKLLCIEFRRRDLPFSTFGRMEAAEYLGVSQEKFETIVKDIPFKEQVFANGEKYIVYYKKDLDVYTRHHRFLDMVAKANATISFEDVVDIIGNVAKSNEFLDVYKPRKMKTVDGYVTDRYSSDDIRKFIASHTGDTSIYNPLKDMISSDMARIYVGANKKEWLRARYERKLIRPVRKANGSKLSRSGKGFAMFLVDDLDRYIYDRDCGKMYGLGREFITRKHIKNRYGVNDKWIDTYAKDSEKVHVKLASGNIMTWYTYHAQKVKEVMVGINYVDIEALIKDGNFIDITREFIRKKLKIDKEENDQRYKKGKFSILMMHKKYVEMNRKSPYQYHEVTDDDVTLALDTKINEPRLVHDEKKRLLKKIKQKEIEHDNKMRNILGLTPVRNTAVTTNDVVKSLVSPQVFRCIYKRGNVDMYKRFDGGYKTYDYVYHPNHFFTKKNSANRVSLSVKALFSGMFKMEEETFSCPPDWFIYMDSSTCISDIFWKEKLDRLPTDVGMVGVYGWKTVPSSFNWHDSHDSYGCYEGLSVKDNSTRKIVGELGFGQLTDVNILGGPIFAIRASMIPDILRVRILNGYVIGDDHIAAELSMFCHECRQRVCVMDTNVVTCIDYMDYVGGDDWEEDQINFVLRWQHRLPKLKDAPAL